MFPTVSDAQEGAVILKIHIPDISFQFEEYSTALGTLPANKSILKEIESRVRRETAKFKRQNSNKLMGSWKADIDRYQAEFEKFAPNFNSLRIEFLCQVYLYQRLFKPENEERGREIEEGLAFFEDFAGNSLLLEFLNRILFAIPTGLLKGRVIAQITLMISQTTTYFIKDSLLNNLEKDAGEQKKALSELWGKKIIHLFMTLALEKIKNVSVFNSSQDDKISGKFFGDSEEIFLLFYENCSLPHLDLICRLHKERPEKLTAVFDQISLDCNLDTGRFKEFDQINSVVLIKLVLLSQLNDPAGSLQGHIDAGARDVWQSKAHFTPLLFLAAMKLQDVPEISGPIANLVRTAARSFSRCGVSFPEHSNAELKGYLEATGYDELKTMAAGYFEVTEGGQDDIDNTRKFLASANDQIRAFSEEELNDFQKALDDRRSTPSITISRKNAKKKKTEESTPLIE